MSNFKLFLRKESKIKCINDYVNGLMAGLISIIILNQKKGCQKCKCILCQQAKLARHTATSLLVWKRFK